MIQKIKTKRKAIQIIESSILCLRPNGALMLFLNFQAIELLSMKQIFHNNVVFIQIPIFMLSLIFHRPGVAVNETEENSLCLSTLLMFLWSVFYCKS